MGVSPTFSSCSPNVFRSVPLNAANSLLYASYTLQTSSRFVRHTSNTFDTSFKHVTHRLEIRFVHAKLSLDVPRLMSNACQRSPNLPITYGLRVRDVWIKRWHQSENFVHAQNIPTTSTYHDVCQRVSACSKLMQNLFKTYSTYASVFVIFCTRWAYVV